jgi:hypothetical protein
MFVFAGITVAADVLVSNTVVPDWMLSLTVTVIARDEGLVA